MTTIDRLGIQGIRSYGGDVETYIRFFKPLTIILGRNGSGKSTIIEAVKMATTGDLPPNVDKGAAFIHDPRIDNETETRAKIRLMFTNIRGDQYVIGRQFQLTIKTGARGVQKTEFKTIHQSLKRMDRDGDTTNAFRCNDLNNLLPDVMRVTKPVLNNVIFVHQEDSLWPLGDAKKLKEKFDEIFAATRYTKALETIRKYRRDQAAELRTVNMEVMHYEDKVRVLEKIRAEVEQIHVNYDQLRKGQDELQRRITEKQTALDAAKALARQWRQYGEELRRFESKRDDLHNDKKEIYANMQNHIQDQSEEQLTQRIEDLQNSINNADEERAKRTEIIENMKADVEMKEAELKMRLQRKGKLEQQLEQQKIRLARLDELKTEFLQQGSLFSEPFTDVGRQLTRPTESSPNNVWAAAFTQMLKDVEQHVKNVAEKGRKEEDTANENVNSVKLNLASCKEEKERKKADIEERRNNLTKINRQLRETGYESNEKENIDYDERVKSCQKLHDQKKESSEVHTHEAKINNNRKELTECRVKLETLRHTREELVKDQSDQERLKFSRETVVSKTNGVNLRINENYESLSSACRTIISKDDESSDLKTLLRRMNKLMGSGVDDDENLDNEEEGDLNADDSDDIDAEISARGGGNPDDLMDKKVKLLLKVGSKVMAKRGALLQSAETDTYQARSQLTSLTAQLKELKEELKKVKKEEFSSNQKLDVAKQELSDTDTQLSEISSSDDENDDDDATFDVSFAVNDLIEQLKGVQISSDDPSKCLVKEHVEAAELKMNQAADAKMEIYDRTSSLKSLVVVAEQDLQKFERDDAHRCPACGLSSKKSEQSMRRKLTRRVNKAKDPKTMELAENWKNAIDVAIKATRNLHSQCCAAMNVLEKSKQLSERVMSLEESRATAKAELEKAQARLSDIQDALGENSELQALENGRFELQQAVSDLGKARRDLTNLQDRVQHNTGETKSLEDVDGEVRELEETMQKLHEDTDKFIRLVERAKDDLRKSESRLLSMQKTALEVKANNELGKRLQLESKTHTEAIKSLRKEVTESTEKLKNIQNSLDDALMVYAEVRATAQAEAQKAGVKLSARSVKVQAWRECYREVEAFARSGKDNEIEKMLEAITKMDEDIKKKRTDLTNHQHDQQTAADSEKAMERTIRNLRDNQRYRLKENALKLVMRDIRRVKDAVADAVKQCSDGDGGGDPDTRVDALAGEVNTLQSQFHATKGKKHVTKQRYDERKRDLDEAERDGSRRKYDECRIKKKTMELASGDLEKYHRALDQALMAFHTLKMSSINRTIKELWQQTYRGMDIDDIEVTSDHNIETGDSTGGVARRNFNYRVVMRRGQAPLDMRGRCSAGQKVLACLVIRLALAESFCSDCGILALDEPTTNLDRANINSLASALRSIIETRKRQRNFQLLLITHDEEFIEELGARDFADEYYKVFKDDNQKSKTVIESLAEAAA